MLDFWPSVQRCYCVVLLRLATKFVSSNIQCAYFWTCSLDQLFLYIFICFFKLCHLGIAEIHYFVKNLYGNPVVQAMTQNSAEQQGQLWFLSLSLFLCEQSANESAAIWECDHCPECKEWVQEVQNLVRLTTGPAFSSHASSDTLESMRSETVPAQWAPHWSLCDSPSGRTSWVFTSTK